MMNEEQRVARNMLYAALRSGAVKKPQSCEECKGVSTWICTHTAPSNTLKILFTPKLNPVKLYTTPQTAALTNGRTTDDTHSRGWQSDHRATACAL